MCQIHINTQRNTATPVSEFQVEAAPVPGAALGVPGSKPGGMSQVMMCLYRMCAYRKKGPTQLVGQATLRYIMRTHGVRKASPRVMYDRRLMGPTSSNAVQGKVRDTGWNES